MKFISRDSALGKYYINKIKELTEDGHLIPELDDIFHTFSDEKMRAYYRCVNKMYEVVDMFNTSTSGDTRLIMNPYDWGVLSANTFAFTFAAILNAHTMNYDYSKKFYLVITKDNIYYIQ